MINSPGTLTGAFEVLAAIVEHFRREGDGIKAAFWWKVARIPSRVSDLEQFSGEQIQEVSGTVLCHFAEAFENIARS